MRAIWHSLFFASFFSLFSCSIQKEETPVFDALSTEETGIDFTNTLAYTEELNPYTFKNFYNGGGVAIGDINNDGLSDVFFCTPGYACNAPA